MVSRMDLRICWMKSASKSATALLSSDLSSLARAFSSPAPFNCAAPTALVLYPHRGAHYRHEPVSDVVRDIPLALLGYLGRFLDSQLVYQSLCAHTNAPFPQITSSSACSAPAAFMAWSIATRSRGVTPMRFNALTTSPSVTLSGRTMRRDFCSSTSP